MNQFLKSFILKRAPVLALVAVAVLSFQNCAKANFSGGNDPSVLGSPNTDQGIVRDNLNQPNTNPGSCYTVLHQQTVPVKMLFVVDTSGSNRGFNGTDDRRVVRGESLQTFFNDLGTRANFNWGFITFHASIATPMIASGVLPIFSSQTADMQNALNAFKANYQDDGGNTPYEAALDMAQQAILNDRGSNDSKYIVVFLSDGMPDPAVATDVLINHVRQIVGTKPGRVTFNTVYYGSGGNTAAIERLSGMAKAGSGNFLNTNLNPTQKSFLISNIVNIPGQVCTP